MKQSNAVHILSEMALQGRNVYALRDLSKLFPDDNERNLKAGVHRLVQSGILVRAVKGVYVYTLTEQKPDILEQIAKTMRRGEYSYVSLESALSEYGMISQIPIDRLTIITTGRKGTYKTPYGVIEFTHTARPIRVLQQSMIDVGRPLRLATKEAAYRDLKRAGRNMHLVDETLLYEN